MDMAELNFLHLRYFWAVAHEMMRLLAREGAGLAAIPPIVVRDELAQGLLAEADTLPGIKETFFAVTPERGFSNPLVREPLAAAPPLGLTGFCWGWS